MTFQRHFLDLDDAQTPAIESLIARARQFKSGVAHATTRLRGKLVLGMFFEASTRTATSFAAAAYRLGATWHDFGAATSSMSKGETPADTMHTVRAVGADAIVVRHWESGYPHALAPHFHGSILNAGDGSHAHPTQGVLDAMTLVEEFGTLAGRRLIICGDIRHSRVARSSARAAWLLGAKVTLCAPPLLLPQTSPGWGFSELSTVLDDCLPQADALMLLRVQTERGDGTELPPFADLVEGYGLTEERLKLLPDHCIIMHPGPVNRDVEVAASLIRVQRSRIDRQVENGVFVRMAVLERALHHAA
ncbi:MAG: aspartate carbamoyltransferase catalytic subunit [Candidatus Eremiobacteraeota bacterium]|nr:aspartate carbamoyltransferase catalytic subunit [Candidatus Eremiobacteraeota bacterium]MBC5826436.1 aspartate carbamoyltransferase catalytic subunit [Candidatus Eremiobacteraeota bacterium]